MRLEIHSFNTGKGTRGSRCAVCEKNLRVGIRFVVRGTYRFAFHKECIVIWLEAALKTLKDFETNVEVDEKGKPVK